MPAPELKKAVVGAVCYSVQPLVLNAISVPVLAYIIHRLGPGGYAQWMVATSLLAVGAVLTNLGLRSAFIRAVAADPDSAPRALAEQLGLRTLLAVAAGSVVVGVCVLLRYPAQVAWCAVAGAGGLVLTTIATTLADLLQGLRRMTVLAGVNMAAGLVLTGISLVVAWRGAGPVGIAAAYVSGPAVSAAALIACARRQIGPFGVRCDWQAFRRLAAGGRFFAAQQLLFAGSSQVEALVLPRLIGLNAFGVFTAGAMPANRLLAIPDGLAAAAYPTMVSACAAGGARGASLVRRFALLGALGGVLVALAVTLIAEPFGRVLVPGHSETFAAVVRITIWALPFAALELVMGYSLNACGREAEQARLAVPASVASLVCSVGLVWGLGLTGACWSMALRPAVRGAFLLPATLRALRAPPDQALRLGTFSIAHLRKAG